MSGVVGDNGQWASLHAANTNSASHLSSNGALLGFSLSLSLSLCACFLHWREINLCNHIPLSLFRVTDCGALPPPQHFSSCFTWKHLTTQIWRAGAKGKREITDLCCIDMSHGDEMICINDCVHPSIYYSIHHVNRPNVGLADLIQLNIREV